MGGVFVGDGSGVLVKVTVGEIIGVLLGRVVLVGISVGVFDGTGVFDAVGTVVFVGGMDV